MYSVIRQRGRTCYSRIIAALVATFTLTIAPAQYADAETTLRVALNIDLKIVDPIWTTAYVSRDYGYMVYDTLFAMDESLNIKPQMVDTWQVSDDGLSYTFTLRDGLLWHDGAPVTAQDVIASIQRWGKKDSLGQKLMDFTREMKAVDERSFQLNLKEPYGLVLMSLAKPSSNVPFIMPKRIAETPADEQISEYIGSGPFIFKANEWQPGNKAVFIKNPDYKPRSEAPSWASGGKVAKVDRVEWIYMPEAATAVNALIAGEIDAYGGTPIDLLPLLENEETLAVANLNPLGNQYMLRLNHLQPPFDNVKIRRAVLAAINQKDFLQATVGNSDYYKICAAMFLCDTPLDTDAGTDILMKSDITLAKKLLEEGGYDGTPIVIMQATDANSLTNLAPVAAQALEKAGFTVDLQAMDWQTLVSRRAKKDKPADGGWHIFMTYWVAADILNPVMAAGFNASCDDAWFGWPCDEAMEQLRDQFAREADPEKQKQIARKTQVRAMEIVTHAHLGQWYQPVAWRTDRLDGVLGGPAAYFWNISKKE